eukprot:8316215-Heterocapsa_arctica.AAC.1
MPKLNDYGMKYGYKQQNKKNSMVNPHTTLQPPGYLPYQGGRKPDPTGASNPAQSAGPSHPAQRHRW